MRECDLVALSCFLFCCMLISAAHVLCSLVMFGDLSELYTVCVAVLNSIIVFITCCVHNAIIVADMIADYLI